MHDSALEMEWSLSAVSVNAACAMVTHRNAAAAAAVWSDRQSRTIEAAKLTVASGMMQTELQCH